MKYIAICEDERATRDLLDQMVREWAVDRDESIQISDYPDAESFLFDYEDRSNWDILILDIQMKEIDGMQLAKLLRERKERAAILFVTAVREAVFEGYQVQAVDYLLKPLEQEQFRRAMDRAAEQCGHRGRSHLVTTEDGYCRIYEEDICWIESRKHDTVLSLRETKRIAPNENRQQLKLLCRRSISSWEKELNKQSFVSCHRSYLIRLSEISAIRRTEIQMSDGSNVPIARGRWETVNRAWLAWCRGEWEGE